MAKQTFTTGQVLTAAQMTSLQANDYNQTVSAKVASYVLVATDAGTRITMSNASTTTITVNTALFTAGDTLTITNIGAGVCTITAGTATVSTGGSLALNQYDSGTLYFTSTGVSIWNGANPGDITGVTAGTGISGGGTSGNVTITNSMATEITAKGDLIAGTGSGTFDNLAAGANGETLVADSSQTTGLRYNPQNALANPIINGGMDIWQRGTSFSLSASTGTTYVSDRWATGTGANQACTISRQATGDTTNLPNIQYALRFQRNSGQTGTGGLSISTSLETVNTIPFAGKTVTMSFYARKGASYAGATFTAYLITGTGTDQNRQSGGYTGESTAITAAITLTTSWVRYVVTGTIPTTATEMAPYIFFDFGGTAGVNDYFDITGFQVDLGTYTASTAPAFRRSQGTIQGELAAAQRYYFRNTGALLYQGSGGIAGNTVNSYQQIKHPTTMRVAPTSVDFSLLMLQIISGSFALTACTISQAAPDITLLFTTVASGLTATTQSYMIMNQNNAAAYLGLSAEL